jgi:hypothetical protein
LILERADLEENVAVLEHAKPDVGKLLTHASNEELDSGEACRDVLHQLFEIVGSETLGDDFFLLEPDLQIMEDLLDDHDLVVRFEVRTGHGEECLDIGRIPIGEGELNAGIVTQVLSP